MKPHFILFITAFLTLFNCEETAKISLDYKYTDQKDLITCENFETKLYKEALYTFESDITRFYDKKSNNTYKAYNSFFKNSIRGNVPYDKIVSPHTMKVFEALKAENDLWITENNTTSLNYNAAIFKCVSNNFIDKDLRVTFNALVSTNSMTPALFGSPILQQISSMSRDKYLTTYMALDHYYSRLFVINPSKIKEVIEEKKEVNKINKETNLKEAKSEPVINKSKTEDPHAGHNH